MNILIRMIIVSCILVISACTDFTNNQSVVNNTLPTINLPQQLAETADLSQPSTLFTKLVWQATDELFSPSSPRLIDLTNDGVLDVIQGDIGRDGISYTSARDGKTGNELWRTSGFTDLFTSAAFIHINKDTIPDIIMGGRSKELIAINGANGELLWQFKPTKKQALWGNFYSSQIIPDQNNDNISDIITTNGGDQANNDNRQPGQLLLISGKTGEIIHSLASPDGRETYMSPVIIYPPQANETTILFGTGGETLPGSLWKISLSGLIAEDSSAFIELLKSDSKGFEAPPAVADFNKDRILDYVVQAFDGSVSLVDGNTNKIIWQLKNIQYESIATPTLGYFVGDDDIPDVFVHINQGIFPEWKTTDYLLLNGLDGNTVWRDTIGMYTPSGSVAIDMNGDHIDEVIFAANQFNNENGVRKTEIYLLDTSKKTATLWQTANRFTVAAPWVGDMDNNLLLDIIFEGTLPTDPERPNDPDPRILVRYELPILTPSTISWGSYMGTAYNGILLTQ